MKNIDDVLKIAKRPCQFCKNLEKCANGEHKKNCAVDYRVITLDMIMKGEY